MLTLVVAAGAQRVQAQPFSDQSSALGTTRPQHELVVMDCVRSTLTCLGQFTGGAAAADYDRDGDVDIYYTRFGGPDALFENQGDGTFRDVAAQVGLGATAYTNGAAFADVDNDGDLDLVVTHGVSGSHALYINDGQTHSETGRPMFSEEAASRGILVASTANAVVMGGSVAAGDFDRDGFVDLYFTEWRPDTRCGESNSRLLQNRGALAPGHFDDVTDAAGVGISTQRTPSSWTFAAAFRDLDSDGWPDLAIVGDYGTSRLFWNNGDQTFTEGGIAAGVATDRTGMGSSFADVDRDGDLDWFVSALDGAVVDVPNQEQWDGNRLYVNEGGRRFSEQSEAFGVRRSGWAWGGGFFDADNDGDHDLIVASGFVTPGIAPQRMHFFVRHAPDHFVEDADGAGISLAGQDQQGRGLITLDYDADGDLDVFVARNGSTPLLLRNEGGVSRGDWLRVRAEGSVGTLDAFGALVRVSARGSGDVEAVESIDSSTDFLGQSERVAHFGLGEGALARGERFDVEVSFLSGHVVRIEDVTPNRVITVREPTSPAPLPRATDRPRGCAGPMPPCAPDCNDNLIDDACELAAAPTLDCNGNAVIDSCELRAGVAEDCDRDGRIDSCEVASDPARDVNHDGVLDACQPVAETRDAGAVVSMDGGSATRDADVGDEATLDSGPSVGVVAESGVGEGATDSGQVPPHAEAGTQVRPGLSGGATCDAQVRNAETAFPMGWPGSLAALWLCTRRTRRRPLSMPG